MHIICISILLFPQHISVICISKSHIIFCLIFLCKLENRQNFFLRTTLRIVGFTAYQLKKQLNNSVYCDMLSKLDR